MTGKPLKKNERPPSLSKTSSGSSGSSREGESPHKALIGLWKHTDRAWIGFRKPGDGEGVQGEAE